MREKSERIEREFKTQNPTPSQKAPLRYLRWESVRACDKCFDQLFKGIFYFTRFFFRFLGNEPVFSVILLHLYHLLYQHQAHHAEGRCYPRKKVNGF